MNIQYPFNLIIFKRSMRLIIVFVMMLFLAQNLMPKYSIAEAKKECVIVLHGMGRTKNSMNRIEKSLVKDNYNVWNESYPSRSENIEKLAVEHIEKGLAFCNKAKAETIHFVTHSLGGIMVRYYLQEHKIDNLGKIVMLSPPNKGSEVADFLKDVYVYKLAMGPAGQQLGTDSNSLPKSMRSIEANVGIITGNKTLDPWFSPLIPGADDGKVSVESAKLEEMSDFMVVESTHAFIMRNALVIDQIKYFLKHGIFKK
ncbi:MAG: esterase/lipase family protein [Planctomycetota bacterium]